MTKEKITGLLFQMLNGQDEFFSDVIKNSAKHTLIIQIPSGERFTIRIDSVEDSDDTMELRAYKNLFAIYAEITLMEMQYNGYLSMDEYKEIWSRISESN